MLPPWLSPFKHYASEAIDFHLHLIFSSGLNIKQAIAKRSHIPAATVREWITQFKANFTVLIHHFFPDSFADRPADYKALWCYFEGYCGGRSPPCQTLAKLQLELCELTYPIGIFREYLVIHKLL